MTRGSARFVPWCHVVCFVLATLLVGCGNSAQLSRADAASRYLRLVEPANSAADHFGTAIGTTPLRVPALHDATNRFDDAMQTLDEGLVSTHWPDTVQREVSDLLASDKRLVVLLRGLEKAGTATEVVAWEHRSQQDVLIAISAVGHASEAVRIRLGLPPSRSSSATS
ncbi:MAG: hypothetical protein QOK30_3362 [Nocardioidaceae bacterium]|nr:hypothetical protein [Nocardioidaceae bacterium]